MRLSRISHPDVTIPEAAEQTRAGARGGATAATITPMLSPAQRGFATGPAQAPAGHTPPGTPRPGTSREAVTGSSAPAGSPPPSRTATGHSMSLDDAKTLLTKRGKAFDYPPFMNEEPPVPRALAELVDLKGMPGTADEVPITLREPYEAYAKEMERWHAQKHAYDHLYNRYTLEIAQMIADGAAPLDITKNRLKLGASLDGEQKAVLYARNPERASFLKLDFDVERHFLKKKDFHLLPKLWNCETCRPTLRLRFLHPADTAAMERLNQVKKELEAQLRLADKDPATTLDSMRDLHTKLQNRLENAIERAIANKKNRQNWYAQFRTLLTWVGAGIATFSTVAYAVERTISMAFSLKSSDNEKSKGNGA